MKIVLGIGNPGTKYENTPHNVGFYFIDSLAESPQGKYEHKAYTQKITLEGHSLLLAKPNTFVNLSGESAGALLQFYKVEPSDLIVITDDVNLEAGAIRVRQKGSHGGHNGLASIIRHCGENFVRIRIGVGLCPPEWDLARFVLRKLKPAEIELFSSMRGILRDLILCGVSEGWESAARRFNRKSL